MTAPTCEPPPHPAAGSEGKHLDLGPKFLLCFLSTWEKGPWRTGKTMLGPDSLGASSVMAQQQPKQSMMGHARPWHVAPSANEAIRHQHQAVMG
jgi:hypothetical protein